MGIEGLKLSPILCDGMILQRDAVNYIYGTDSQAVTVTVSFMNKEYSASVNEYNEFQVELPPVEAGGPYDLIVKGSSEIIIKDILFGDVYILSGQSNMELQLDRVMDVSAEEIKNTCEPIIRQYLIPATYNFSEPEKYMYQNTWKKAMGEDLLGFSAAGYFFAKAIKDEYQVPIGLIMTAVGGSCIEAWMNPSTLSKFGDYNKLIEDFKNIDNFNEFIEGQQEEVNEWLSKLSEEEPEINPSKEFKQWEVCKVPSMVTDYNTGEFQGSVYLCKEVYLEEEPIMDDAFIYMGSIIDSDRVWINQEEVGSTEYRYPPRKYMIKKGILKQGNNLITVRIVINNKNGGTIKGKPYYLYCDGQKINLEGDWNYKIGLKASETMPDVLFPPNLPIAFYHTAIVPLGGISVKGVLWYQGESNTEDPKNYAEKFTAMVSDWRDLFGWEIPFIYVQLANYRDPLNTLDDTGWAQLRDQQRQCLAIHNVAMVSAIDIGEYNDIHPQNKKEVGLRLANAARSLVYKEKITYSGPIPTRATVDGNTAKIAFKHLEDFEKEQSLNNFELAGADGVFHEASAILKGKYVTLSSEQINMPKYARYAWSDNPQNLNFFNESGLPAVGFCLEL